MAGKKDITFYRFYSGMRSFLSKLLKKPIEAEVPSFLEDIGVSRKKLINELMDKSVIERHERILDSTNSDNESPTYSVKYKVRRKNFEKKMHRLYSKYFENDDKEELNECDCGGCLGGGGSFGDSGEGATNTSVNAGHPDVLATNTVINRGSFYKDRDELKEPKKNKKKKNIYLTESQVKYLNEFFNTKTIGDLLMEDEAIGATTTEIVNGNEVPRRSDKKKGIAGGVVFRTKDGKLDPAYDRKYKAN